MPMLSSIRDSVLAWKMWSYVIRLSILVSVISLSKLWGLQRVRESTGEWSEQMAEGKELKFRGFLEASRSFIWGRYSHESWIGVCHEGSWNLTLFKD